MNCQSCGTVLREHAKFCGNCGNPVEEKSIKEVMLDRDISKEYQFKREKYLGKLVVQEILTDVKLEEALMKYKQKRTTLYWFQKELVETEHHITDFVSIQCSRTIDLSFLLLGVLALFIGFESGEFFYVLFALLLWWIGLGSKVVITKSNGAKIKIAGSNRSECESLIRDLVCINKSIVIKA